MCEVCMVCGNKLSALHTGHPTCSDCKAKRVGGWDVRRFTLSVSKSGYGSKRLAQLCEFKGILPDAKAKLREMLAEAEDKEPALKFAGRVSDGGETIYFEERRG